MRSRPSARNADAGNEWQGLRHGEAAPDQIEDEFDTTAEPDESSDLDESDLSDSDDDRWDIFLLDDDDRDPLPEYGDFWMPD